jgi:hypothetical protein
VVRTPYRGPHAHVGTVWIIRNIRVARAHGPFLAEITSLQALSTSSQTRREPEREPEVATAS